MGGGEGGTVDGKDQRMLKVLAELVLSCDSSGNALMFEHVQRCSFSRMETLGGGVEVCVWRGAGGCHGKVTGANIKKSLKG